MDPDFSPSAGAVSVRAVKFWTKYVPQPDGTTKGVDWVEYAPRGKAKYSTIPEAIPRLQKDRSGLWEALQPAYDAWKRGQEIPTNGTPLAAWPGVSVEQAEMLRTADCRTVEEVAELTDAIMQRIGLPGLRDIRTNAQAFLTSKDGSKVASALAQKDEQIAALQAQMQDLMDLITKPGEADEPKRGRGRPPKDAPIDHEHAA